MPFKYMKSKFYTDAGNRKYKFTVLMGASGVFSDHLDLHLEAPNMMPYPVCTIDDPTLNIFNLFPSL